MYANNTAVAVPTSASSTCSSGEWLTPPRHRTNTIPTLVSDAMASASCPAPLVSIGTGAGQLSSSQSGARGVGGGVRMSAHVLHAAACCSAAPTCDVTLECVWQ